MSCCRSSDFQDRLGASRSRLGSLLSWLTLLLFSVCANRVFVQDGIYEKFSEKLAEAVRKFKVGEGTGEGMTHGPLIHAAALEKVSQYQYPFTGLC